MQKAFSKLKLPFFFVITLLLLFHISAVTEGVKNALGICAFSIIPSLFIFLVLSDVITSILLSESKIGIPPKWTVFLLGSLCGFPVGAIACERLCQGGILAKKEAERLLPLSNNTSPSFVIGAIGTAMLGDAKLGVLLFFAQCIAALLLFLPIRAHTQDACESKCAESLAKQFFDAVEKSVSSILKICALICLFSALLSVLHLYCGETSYILLSILLEIGNGAACASTLFLRSPAFSVALCGFVCGWGGFCVHFQIFSALKSIKVNKFRFCFYKCLHGLFTASLAYVGYKLFFCS